MSGTLQSLTDAPGTNRFKKSHVILFVISTPSLIFDERLALGLAKAGQTTQDNF